MGLRREIIDTVFKGNKNIWTNIIVSGSAPSASTTASVGTFCIGGTGASSARVVWIKVYSGSTGITTSSTGLTGAGGTWVRISY